MSIQVVPNHGPIGSFLARHAGHEVEVWKRDDEQGAACVTCGDSFQVATMTREQIKRIWAEALDD